MKAEFAACRVLHDAEEEEIQGSYSGVTCTAERRLPRDKPGSTSVSLKIPLPEGAAILRLEREHLELMLALCHHSRNYTRSFT